MPSCRKLEMHRVRRPFSLAVARAGSKSAARIAMIAITTSSSIRVNALCLAPHPALLRLAFTIPLAKIADIRATMRAKLVVRRRVLDSREQSIGSPLRFSLQLHQAQEGDEVSQRKGE